MGWDRAGVGKEVACLSPENHILLSSMRRPGDSLVGVGRRAGSEVHLEESGAGTAGSVPMVPIKALCP